MQLRINKRDIFEKICCCVIAAYVITAMAFECTPNTSRYSTWGIYAVFLIGILFIIIKKKIKLKVYAFSQYFMYAYVLLMSNASGASSSMGQEIPYLYLTCVVVCYIVYYVTYCYPKLIHFLLWGVVIGAIVLAYRIVQAYGGISLMLQFASLDGERRVGGNIINENTLGLYMANATLCCILMLFRQRKMKGTLVILLVSCSIVFISMSLLSGSKKAIAFLLVGICGILWLFAKRLRLDKKLVMYFGIILGVTFLFQAIQSVPFFGTISNRLEELVNTLTGEKGAAQTDKNRINMTMVGLEAFMNSPIFGNGTGHSYIHFNTYSHNNPVEILMNYGVIGFSLYYVPYAMLVFALLKMSNQGDKLAAYFLVYTVLQLGLGIGWVNYYERVVQVISAAAWGYVEHVNEKGVNNY